MQPQRALRSKKFNPDRKYQSRLEIFNPDRKFQSRSKISIPRCFYLLGPPGVTERGSIENLNPRSIARNFQSRRPRSNFFDPRALWGMEGSGREGRAGGVVGCDAPRIGLYLATRQRTAVRRIRTQQREVIPGSSCSELSDR